MNETVKSIELDHCGHRSLIIETEMIFKDILEFLVTYNLNTLLAHVKQKVNKFLIAHFLQMKYDILTADGHELELHNLWPQFFLLWSFKRIPWGCNIFIYGLLKHHITSEVSYLICILCNTIAFAVASFCIPQSSTTALETIMLQEVNSHHVLLCCGHRKARRLLTRSQLRRACRQPCEQINLRRVPQGPAQGPILAPPHPSLRMRGPIVIHDWPSSVPFHLPISSLGFLPLIIQDSGHMPQLCSLWKYRNSAFSEA